MKILDVEQAVSMVRDGDTIMVGGFLGVGTPESIMDELVRQGKKNLTLIVNDTAFVDKGVGKLIVNKLIKKLITSHIGTNSETQKQMMAGDLEVELVPQGTFVERIRAAGAGLGGVLTPTGIGTMVEEGKRKIEIEGKEYLLELPLKADFAFLKAKEADYNGNLIYSLTAKNFNPIMALAADQVVVEVEEIVPVGVLPPDYIHTPHVFVDYVVRRSLS
jgi:acetate CoA/acetoacetate CoA-transferase alpha subunit